MAMRLNSATGRSLRWLCSLRCAPAQARPRTHPARRDHPAGASSRRTGEALLAARACSLDNWRRPVRRWPAGAKSRPAPAGDRSSTLRVATSVSGPTAASCSPARPEAWLEETACRLVALPHRRRGGATFGSIPGPELELSSGVVDVHVNHLATEVTVKEGQVRVATPDGLRGPRCSPAGRRARARPAARRWRCGWPGPAPAADRACDGAGAAAQAGTGGGAPSPARRWTAVPPARQSRQGLRPGGAGAEPPLLHPAWPEERHRCPFGYGPHRQIRLGET